MGDIIKKAWVITSARTCHDTSTIIAMVVQYCTASFISHTLLSSRLVHSISTMSSDLVS